MTSYARRLAILLVLLLSTGVTAAELPFSKTAFDAARAAGKPVVIHAHSRWCLTCRRQESVVAPMLAKPEFKQLLLLRADWATDKALFRELNVTSKSTFIAFTGNTEVGRSVGDTDERRIESLFRKALKGG